MSEQEAPEIAIEAEPADNVIPFPTAPEPEATPEPEPKLRDVLGDVLRDERPTRTARSPTSPTTQRSRFPTSPRSNGASRRSRPTCSTRSFAASASTWPTSSNARPIGFANTLPACRTCGCWPPEPDLRDSLEWENLSRSAHVGPDGTDRTESTTTRSRSCTTRWWGGSQTPSSPQNRRAPHAVDPRSTTRWSASSSPRSASCWRWPWAQWCSAAPGSRFAGSCRTLAEDRRLAPWPVDRPADRGAARGVRRRSSGRGSPAASSGRRRHARAHIGHGPAALSRRRFACDALAESPRRDRLRRRPCRRVPLRPAHHRRARPPDLTGTDPRRINQVRRAPRRRQYRHPLWTGSISHW